MTVSTTTDYFIRINKTTPAAAKVNLPASPSAGLTFVIKGCGGVAATCNDTIAPSAGSIDNSVHFTRRSTIRRPWSPMTGRGGK